MKMRMKSHSSETTTGKETKGSRSRDEMSSRQTIFFQIHLSSVRPCSSRNAVASFRKALRRTCHQLQSVSQSPTILPQFFLPSRDQTRDQAWISWASESRAGASTLSAPLWDVSPVKASHSRKILLKTVRLVSYGWLTVHFPPDFKQKYRTYPLDENRNRSLVPPPVGDMHTPALWLRLVSLPSCVWCQQFQATLWDSPIQSQGPYKLTYIWQLQCCLVTLWRGILPQHFANSGCKELWHVDTCCSTNIQLFFLWYSVSSTS